MAQSASSRFSSGRRAFLTIGGAVAASAPLAGRSFAAPRRNATAARRPKTAETAAALRDLWVDHIFWMRNMSAATLDKNDAALQVSEAQAVDNAKAIAGSIEPFYGAPAKDVFFKLLAGHYGAVKAYVVATAGGDSGGQSKATDDLNANADAIADFLSKANPNLPKDAVKGLLMAHGGHHIRQIQELKAHNYASEAQTWREMKAHVYKIADATADAVAKQFPAKFG